MGSAVETSNTTKKPLPISQPVLDLFWELAEINQVKQAQAAVKLVQSLKSDSVKIETEDDHGDIVETSQSMEYCLSRLVRGLASNRKGARWGYGAALTVLLQEFPHVKTSKVLQDMEALLKINSPQDMKTVGVGRLALYMILINSGRLEDISASNLRTVMEGLFHLEKEKPYLKSGVQEIVKQLIQKVPSDQFDKIVLPQLKKYIAKPLAGLDLDDLYLLLKASQSHEKPLRSVLKQNFGTVDLFATAHVQEICKFLFKTNSKTEVYHPAVLEFSDEFASRPALFPEFWKTMITLASAETPLKVRIPLDVAVHLLKRTENQVEPSLVLTKLFLVYLFRNTTERRGVSDGLKALHHSASNALQVVNATVHKITDQKTLMEIISSVLEFDSVEDIPKNKSWSHFVVGILRRLDLENTVKVTNKLTESVNLSSSNTENVIRVIHILEQICFDKIKSVEDVKKFESPIRVLAQTAFTSTTSDASNLVADTARKDLARFVTSSGIDIQAHGKFKNPLWSGVESEKDILIKLAVIDVIVSDKDVISSDNSEIRKDALALAKKAKSLPINVVFQRVLELIASSIVGFWMHSQPVLCREIIDELTPIVDKLKKLGKKVTAADVMEKLMPFLVSLLPVNKWMFPTVELVFRNLCPFLNEKCLDVILEVLHSDTASEDDEAMEFESSGDENDEDDASDLEDVEEGVEDLAIDRAVLKQVPGIAQEDGDESEPDLDDDTMFQLDEVLANILRARKAERHKNDNDVDPRLRALQLINIYCAYKEADPLLVLSLVLPVMHVANEKVQGAQRQKHTLLVNSAGRTLLLLKMQRKWDLEDVQSRVSKEDLAETLKELIAESGKVHELKLFQQFTEGVLYGFRILIPFLSALPETAIPFIRELFVEIIQDFASKRGSAFAHTLVDRLLTCSNKHAITILPDILAIIFSQDPAKKYLVVRQTQLCAIASNILRNSSKTAVAQDEMKAFMMIFGKEFCAMLKRFAESEEPLKQKKLLEETTELARMILGWHSKLKKFSVEIESLGYFWNVKEIETLAEDLLTKKLETTDCRVTKRAVLSLKLSLIELSRKTSAEESEERPAKKAKRESSKEAGST